MSRAVTGILVAAAIALSTAPARAQDWTGTVEERYRACLDRVASEPEEAYEDALQWRGEGGGARAKHCVAAALVALDHPEEGATLLEDAADAPDGGTAQMRGEMLRQAAEAWLSVGDSGKAEHALTRGLAYQPGRADLLVDRAIALGLQKEFRRAADDLSGALASDPTNVEAMRLRAEAYLQLGRLDAAETDITRALALAPDDVESHLVRGRLRETRRTGEAPAAP